MKYKVHDLYPKLDFSENQFWADQRTSVFHSFEKWRNLMNGVSMSRITLWIFFLVGSYLLVTNVTESFTMQGFESCHFHIFFQNSVKLKLEFQVRTLIKVCNFWVPGSNPNQTSYSFSIYLKVRIQTIFIVQKYLWASSQKISQCIQTQRNLFRVGVHFACVPPQKI